MTDDPLKGIKLPDPKAGLLDALLKAIGLLKDNGTVDTAWFGSPLANSVPKDAARRRWLADAVARLVGAPDPRQWADAETHRERWFGLAGPLQVVLAGQGEGAVGLGLRLPMTSPSPPTPPLAEVRGWLLGVGGGKLKLGPDIPDFLTLRTGLKISTTGLLRELKGTVGYAQAGVQVAASLTAALTSDASALRTHELKLDATSTPRALIGEAVKLGLFLAERGVRREALAGKALAVRLRDHLFPLLEGEKVAGQQVLQPFPLADCLTSGDPWAPVVEWLKGFAPTPRVGNPLPSIDLDRAARALTHLKALFTGTPGAARDGSRVIELLGAEGDAQRLALRLVQVGNPGWRVELVVVTPAGAVTVSLFQLTGAGLEAAVAVNLPPDWRDATVSFPLGGESVTVKVAASGAVEVAWSGAQPHAPLVVNGSGATLRLPIPGFTPAVSLVVEATSPPQPASPALTVALDVGGVSLRLLGQPPPTLGELVGALVLPKLVDVARELLAQQLEGTEVTLRMALRWAGVLDTTNDVPAQGLASLTWAKALSGLGAGLLAHALKTAPAGDFAVSVDLPALSVPPLSLKKSAIEIGVKDLGLGAPKVAVGLKGLEVALRAAPGHRLIDVADVSVAGVVLKAALSLGEGTPLRSLAVELEDVRLPFGRGTTGLAAGLLGGNARENPGLALSFTIDAGKLGALDFPPLRLPIGRRIGPLEVRGVEVRPVGGKAVRAAIDATFALGPLEVTPFGLGVDIPVETGLDPATWVAALDGLGVSFQTDAIQLAGLLRRVEDASGEEYRGALMARAFGFQLGALGAYRQLDGVPSFFVFASVSVPLGGPPFFFVTGLAGGFGVNRSLKIPGTIDEIGKMPFLTLMSGALSLADAERQIADWVKPSPGGVWLAAGVTFKSFGLIDGQALLYIVFSPWFELGIMATAQLSVGAIAHVKLGLLGRFSMQNDDPTLLVMAGLTKESWLLNPSLCTLTGGFALQTWPARGQTVLTIGGYHPEYPVPDHYPVVPRVGFRFSIAGVVAKGECYFAVVPSAAMAGALLEVSGTWGPVSAGFRVRFNALIGWDPFWFRFDLEVLVWVRFGFTLELGISLELWGEPVGGVGQLKLPFMTVSIPFGADPAPKPALPLKQFVETHLGLTTEGAGPLRVPALTQVPKQAALFDVEIRAGGLATPAPGGSAQAGAADATKTTQDGSAGAPFRVGPEFKLRLRSRLPASDVVWESSGKLVRPADRGLEKWRPLSIAPCELFHVSSPLRVTHTPPSGSVVAGTTPQALGSVPAPLPAALYAPRTIQQGAAWAQGDPTVERWTGVDFDGVATLVESALGKGGLVLAPERSTAAERFDLPLRSAHAAALHAGSAPLLAASLGAGGAPTRATDLDALAPGLSARWAALKPIAPILRSPWAGIAPPFWGAVGPIDPTRPARRLATPRVPTVQRPWRLEVVARTPRLDAVAALPAAPAFSVARRSGPTIEAPTMTARSAGLASVVLHRFDAAPRGLARSARAGSRGEAALRAVRPKGGDRLIADAGVGLVLHDLHAPTARPLDVTGDQWAALWLVGPAGTGARLLRCAPGYQRAVVPPGRERAAIFGLGRGGTSAPTLEADTVLLRIGGRCFATPEALVRVLAGAEPSVRGATATFAAIVPLAGELLIELPAPALLMSAEAVEEEAAVEEVEAAPARGRLARLAEAVAGLPVTAADRTSLLERWAEQEARGDEPARLQAIFDRWVQQQVKRRSVTPDQAGEARAAVERVLEGPAPAEDVWGALDRWRDEARWLVESGVAEVEVESTWRALAAAARADGRVEALERRWARFVARAREKANERKHLPDPQRGGCVALRFSAAEAEAGVSFVDAVQWEVAGAERAPLAVVEAEGLCLLVPRPAFGAIRLTYRAGFRPTAVAWVAASPEEVAERLASGRPGWPAARPARGTGRTAVHLGPSIEDAEGIA